MKQKLSWKEKLSDQKDLPKTGPIPIKMQKRWGNGTLLIPSPQQVNTVMQQVPKGKIITVNEIRQKLAKQHRTTITCPIVTGIFVWIAAHAAEEEANEGKKRITPYWRTLKSNGELNPKYPGGIENQKKKLKAEGHKLISKGDKYTVQDYKKLIFSFK